MFPAVPPRLVDGSQFCPPSSTLGPTRAGWPLRTVASASISNSPAGVGRYRLSLNKSKMPFSRSRTVSKWLEAEELAAFLCINSSISGGILSRNSDAQSAQGKGSLLINRLVRAVFGSASMAWSQSLRTNPRAFATGSVTASRTRSRNAPSRWRIAGTGKVSRNTCQPRASRPSAIANTSSVRDVMPKTDICGLPMTSRPGIASIPSHKRRR